MFYGTEDKPMTLLELKNARDVCRFCPARTDCLVDALKENERFGIWGGFTTPERDRIIAKHGSAKLTGVGRVAAALPAVLAAMRTGELEHQVVML